MKGLHSGISFDECDIDLITVHIYEAADAELQLLDAQYKYFAYRAVDETARIGVAFSN